MPAKRYIVAWHDTTIDFPPSEEDLQRIHSFNLALLGLVRASSEVAGTKPDQETPVELRWVPVAKQMLRACTRSEMRGDVGVEKSLLFSDSQAEMQVELYREAHDLELTTQS